MVEDWDRDGRLVDRIDRQKWWIEMIYWIEMADRNRNSRLMINKELMRL